jgi:hypothetical protein
MSATGDTFAVLSGGAAYIQVNAGGHLTASSGTTFKVNSVTLNSGASANLRADVFYNQLAINSNTTISIAGNDFSNLKNPNGLVASGDPNATITLSGNYWGTSDPVQIGKIIQDHNDDPTRPTVNFSPYVSGASGTSASAVTATFGPTDQTLTLSATVTTTAGVPINEGTETFTIWNGTQQIGQTTAPANVSNGNVQATWTLPGNTPAGQYIIEADYSGSLNYLPATDLSHFLTIKPAATVTTTSNASATFSGVSDQTIPLSAQISSAAGPVNEGQVTFTIYSGGNPVGSPVTANVSNNTAAANYTLLTGTPGGSYTIQAVYTDPVDFVTSTGTNTLTVSAAATTVTPSSASTTYSGLVGEGITLSANVSSPAGTINQGTVAFTILNAQGKQIVPTVYVNVANGLASGNYVLPAGTAVGSYTIQAVYDGTSSFANSLPATSTLTITGSATTTTAASASVPFSLSAQSVSLSATVTSPGGTVGEGQVTFTVLSGGTTIGSPVSANVTSGTASVNYSLPAAAAIGTYNIQAVFTDPTNYVTSSDTSHTLTVSQPPATQLKIHIQPSTFATAGQPFPTQPVVYEEDANGNLETGDNTKVITASLGTGAGPLQGTLTATVVNGVATFANLGDLTAETITIRFSSGNLASATSTSVTVGPAAGTRLVVTQQPSPTATAASVFATQPVVKLEDQYGNVVVGDSTDTVTATRGPDGTSTLEGTTTVTLVNGVATFSGLSYNKAEVMDISFSTDASGVSSATSNKITVGPTAATQLVIAQQPSSTAVAGQAFPTQPVVYLEDPYGNVETGDNSTVIKALVNSGAGPLQGTTSVTVVGGVAAFTNLADNTAENLTLKFATGPMTSSPSNVIAVGSAPAAQWVFQTQPYASVTAGNPLTDPIVLQEADQFGNLVSGDNSTVVTASLATGSGTLKGTTSVTVVGGVASFDDIEVDKAGTVTLQFSGGSAAPAISNPSTIHPAHATTMEITKRPPGGVVAGQSFPVAVEAHDPFGNVDTNFTGAVTLGVAGGSGSLSGTLTENAVAGVASFDDVSSTTSGPISLQATSGTSLSSPPTDPITVSPSTPSALVFRTQPSAMATAGAAFPIQPVVLEVDQFGNLVSGDNTTVVTAVLASGAGPLSGTTSATLSGGVATFSGLAANTAATITLQFAGGGLSTPASSPVTVNPAAASKLAIHIQPSTSATAGQPFATQPVIWEEDAFGNLETGDNTTVVTATAASGAGPFSGTAAVTLSGGVAKFDGLADQKAETIALSFSGGGLNVGPSGNVVVGAGELAKLVIQGQPSQAAIAGQAFATQPVIQELDAFDNPLLGDNTTVITAFVGTGAGPLSGKVTATARGGVATFASLAGVVAGTITLEFTGGGVTSGASIPIVVSPGAPARLAIQAQPSATATAGTPFVAQPWVYVADQYGNLEPADNSTVVTASLASGAGPLQGQTSVTVQGGVAKFTNLEDNKAETITLSFSAGGLSAATSSPITIIAGAPARLAIQTEPSAAAVAGQPFATQPAVYEEDQYGNPVTADNSTVVTASLASGAGPLRGALSVAVKDGLATFAGLADDTVETISLSFSAGGLAAGPSTSIVVGPAPTRLVIARQPSASATAGQPFATQPVVYEEDAQGNLVKGDYSSVVTVSLASGAGPLVGTTSVTLRGGVATFANLGDATGETLALRFLGGNLASPPTTPIAVAAATPSVLSASATTGKGKNALLVYTITFSGPISPQILGNRSSYEIDTATVKGKKTTYKSVGFNVSGFTSNSVTLALTSKQKFTSGGRILLKGQLVVKNNPALTIAKGGKTVTVH